EALFILTLLETGTRVARFVFQETMTGGSDGATKRRSDEGRTQSSSLPTLRESAVAAESDSLSTKDSAISTVRRKPHLAMNITMSVVVCFAWGYLLYMGSLNTLWRMLGIANQLLAAIALAVGTTYLLNHAPKRKYALCTAVPFVFILATVFTAGIKSIDGWWAESL